MKAQEELLLELANCDLSELFDKDWDPRDEVFRNVLYFWDSERPLPRARIVYGCLSIAGGYAELIMRCFLDIGFVRFTREGDIDVTKKGLAFARSRYVDDPGASVHVLTESPPPWPEVDPMLDIAIRVRVMNLDDRQYRFTLTPYGRSFRDRFKEIWSIS